MLGWPEFRACTQGDRGREFYFLDNPWNDRCPDWGVKRKACFDPATYEWLCTCTIITGEPNKPVAQIHTRMPVILPEEDHAKRLGEAEDGDLKPLLKPFPADQMRIWIISPRVNSPENNDPEIIDPIPADLDDRKLTGP